LLLAGSARAATAGAVDASNSPQISETEPFVAVDPFDPNRVLAGSNQNQPLAPSPANGAPGGNGSVDTGVWASSDGGRSWKGGTLSAGGFGPFSNPLQIGTLPGEFADVGNVIEADQSEGFDRAGNAYFANIDLYSSKNAGDGDLRVWRWPSRGLGWGAPVVAVTQSGSGQLMDRPWLVVDNAGGQRDGTLYLSYETAFYQNVLNAVFLVKSTDHGATWSQPVRVDQGDATQADPRQAPAVGAGGVLYDVYDTGANAQDGPQTEPITLTLARSADGGRSFQRFTVDSNANRIQSPDEADSYFVEFIPAIAADPTHPGRVAVAWPEANSTDNSRIVLRYTLNGGATWSPRIDVPADPAGRNDQHDHLWLSYAPDGRLFVIWRDRRCCGGSFTDPFNIYARVLNPDNTGRLKLGREIQVTPKPVTPTTSTRGSAPDEYIAAAASTAGIAVVWDQQQGAFPDLFYRRIPLSAFNTNGCTLTVRLHAPHGQRIVKASVYLGGRPLLTRRGPHLTRLQIAGLPPGPMRLTIRTTSDRGTRTTITRRYRGC
jgi:hypothetical protein